MNVKIQGPRREIAAFCRRHGIRRLALFGSVLREDFGPDSDVDVLVEFQPDTSVGFFELYDMEQELSAILGGKEVDIQTPSSLSKYFRDEILEEAEVQYAGNRPVFFVSSKRWKGSWSRKCDSRSGCLTRQAGRASKALGLKRLSHFPHRLDP